MSLSTFPNFHEPYSSHIFPKVLFLLSTTPDLNGIFTNFSHEPTWRWYFAITPFETFFLGIILTQFAVLNLLGIFPLNLSALINGMSNGRRKRNAFKLPQRNRDIAGQLLKLMKKLDPDECSFKSICELEAFRHFSNNDNYTAVIPESITEVLLGLKQISKKRERGELFLSSAQNSEDSEERLSDLQIPGIDKTEDDVIALYEMAVKIGDSRPQKDQTNETSPCEKRYHRCPVTGEEILGYIGMMQRIDDLLQF